MILDIIQAQYQFKSLNNHYNYSNTNILNRNHIIQHNINVI